MDNQVPGIKSQHVVITPTCRSNRGVEGAIDEALARIKATYLAYAFVEPNQYANWHVILTVMRCPFKPEGSSP